MTYEELLEAARADPRVLGLVLTGSRGIHAFVRRESAWDVRLLVAGRALRECEKRYETARGSAVEVALYSLEQLEQVRCSTPGSLTSTASAGHDDIALA